jgi:hypothetical protein
LADVPVRLDVGAVTLLDREGHGVCDEPTERPQRQSSRP